MTIQIETTGRRHYLRGDTYSVRDRMRAAGCKWDADARAWWTGKRDVAEQIAGELASVEPAARNSDSAADRKPHDGMDSHVAGRATYKGRTYYIAGRVVRGDTRWDDGVQAVTTRDGLKVLLYFRDGSSQFWAAVDAVEITRRYERAHTLRSLAEYAAEARQSRARGSDYQTDYGWRGNGCGECQRIGDWCRQCAFDEFDN